MPGTNLTPNANDAIINAANGQFTEIGRTLIRRLSESVGELAPVAARYLVTSAADASPLSNKVNLGSLSSGYLKITTAVGIAIPSTSSAIPQADVTGLVAALSALTTAISALPTFVPRVDGTTSSATPTPNADTTDLYSLTAQAAAAAFANPTGTPANGQRLTIRIKDNGTARALTWGTAYVAGGVALPATTVLSKILTLGFIYNTDNALQKWQLVSSAQET